MNLNTTFYVWKDYPNPSPEDVFRFEAKTDLHDLILSATVYLGLQSDDSVDAVTLCCVPAYAFGDSNYIPYNDFRYHVTFEGRCRLPVITQVI